MLPNPKLPDGMCSGTPIQARLPQLDKYLVDGSYHCQQLRLGDYVTYSRLGGYSSFEFYHSVS